MNRWSYLLDLMRQAFIHDDLWYITLPLFALVALAIYKNYIVDKTRPARRHLFALVPFVFPLLLLVFGALFEHTLTVTEPVAAWQIVILWGTVIGQVLINGLCLAFFKEIRLSLLALAMLQGWLTLFPFAVAVMSTTGIWF